MPFGAAKPTDATTVNRHHRRGTTFDMPPVGLFKGIFDMATWTRDELDKIGQADELEIAALRHDGTLRKPVIIWVVRYEDDLYVRSGYGRDAAWFRGTPVSHEGHIKAGGIDKNVAFEDADHALDEQIDAVYRRKYGRYGAQYVDMVVAPEARSTTIRLVPRTLSP
jgi:hypothetical protein